MTSDPSEACIQTIREALKERDPDVVLRVTRMGDPSSWVLIGMLRAAARLAEAELMDGWESDDE